MLELQDVRHKLKCTASLHTKGNWWYNLFVLLLWGEKNKILPHLKRVKRGALMKAAVVADKVGWGVTQFFPLLDFRGERLSPGAAFLAGG